MSTVSSPTAESVYWLTIMFSQTLGTAWVTGRPTRRAWVTHRRCHRVRRAARLVVAACYWTGVFRTLLLWAAFILPRPQGAVVDDFLDKPLSAGGLAFSRYSASAALLAFMLTAILLFRQQAARTAH
ncbi:hypothetical protein LMG28727_07663 [Paraburkholderia kirstenboschensis]|nr:hypothetical protein LMG28727_07663 [Paraburkholderia kirstenboschensis]